ncbi:MAG: protein phosphatase 2C domain-containing protein [Gammaproteobacteria bacterium]|jgi:serine/threonine protein phosphatase PrpC|nr:protein phosphatase 2C domain-containing protein [Gammaproteobacteria bacterium]
MSDITIRQPIHWTSAQASNVGMVREVNEDSVLSLPENRLWAVADGMGGYEAGNVASNMIVKALDSMTIKSSSLHEIIDNVEDSLIDANRRILEYADTRLQGRTLGSTVVTLIIKGHAAICLWAGDSRLYRYRDNQLVQLSRDHSHVAELVSAGIISAEEAENHPNSNIITRAIGTNTDICIDIDVFSARPGDKFLLCSDGLYNMLSKDEIASTIAAYTVNEAVAMLIQKTLDNGAKDNVSVILVTAESQAASTVRARTSENNFSALLRKLSSDFYYKRIGYEEYRAQRKVILDRIDEDTNGRDSTETQTDNS